MVPFATVSAGNSCGYSPDGSFNLTTHNHFTINIFLCKYDAEAQLSGMEAGIFRMGDENEDEKDILTAVVNGMTYNPTPATTVPQDGHRPLCRRFSRM